MTADERKVTGMVKELYRIEKFLSESSFEGNENSLELEQTRLELFVKPNETLSGQIYLASVRQSPVHCFFCSNHYRMHCITTEFTAKEGIFKYKFDAYGLEPGDVVEGEITILSNVGEYPLPFLVTVGHACDNTDRDSIRNLFHFTNLARTNFDEAVRLFYEEDFETLFTGHDRQYYGLYRGLSANKGNAHNVDQFLIAIHKKQENTYEINDRALLLSEADIIKENEFEIRRNGWGYTHLTVEVVGGFLETDKLILTSEDFKQDVCRFQFRINVERLRDGRNLGKFIFHAQQESVTCDIAIHMPVVMERQLLQRKEYNTCMAHLMRLYVEYRTNGKKSEECLSQMEHIIDQINSQGGRNVRGRLLQTHVLLEMERENEARWILSHVDQIMDRGEVSVSAYAYYLYLTACLEHEESTSQQVASELLDIVHDEPMEFLPVCFYLRLMRFAKSASIRKLAVYEEYYYKGTNSPILYLDAWEVLKEGMAYLTKLGEFEIAVIRFAMKYGMFTQDAAKQVNHLAKRRHEMSQAMYYMLMKSYELFPDDETLNVLCGLMIRMGYHAKEHFPWYAKAVERELRITTLYEYYFMSMDMKQAKLPPQIVLMYFSYDCRLDDGRKAFLYRLIIEHRAQIRPIFNQYAPKIEQFTWEMLKKEIINENLTVLYRFLLNEDANLEKALPYLLKLAFYHQISVKGKFEQVILIEDKLEAQKSVRLEHGHAFISCISNDYTILLEDAHGNRYFDPALFTDSKLMATEKIAMKLQRQGEDSIEFLLYSVEVARDIDLNEKKYWPYYERLALSEEVEKVYRQKIYSELLQTYYENDAMDALKKLLERFDFAHAKKRMRAQAVRYLIATMQDEKAFSVLYDYGFEEVFPKALTRLIDRSLEEKAGEMGCDEKLLALTYHTFLEGKYTPGMLEYLCQHYWGSIRQMRDIFLSAVRFDIDASFISERIIEVALFDHGYIAQLEDVFVYYEQHAKQRRESVVRRYIQQMAYDYFVNRHVGQKAVFGAIERYLREDNELAEICQIAYLSYMASECKEYSSLQKKLIERLVRRFVYKKQYVPFMERFVSFIPWLSMYAKWTYIVYRTRPHTKVILHYIKNQEGEEYNVVQMTDFGGGYYCQKFLLLFGESIQYYFVETDGEQEKLTESGYIEKSDIMEDENESRFSMLNDLMMSISLEDQITRKALTQEYLRKERLIKLLFHEI